MVFSVINALFLLAFLLAAVLQYNDPDPLSWMGIYLVAALMCTLSILRRQPLWLPPTLLLVAVGWAISLLPGIIGQVSISEVVESISMKTRAVEEAREIGGLLLISFWAATLWYRNIRSSG